MAWSSSWGKPLLIATSAWKRPIVRHAVAIRRASASAGSPRSGSAASMTWATSAIARSVTAAISASRVGKWT